MTDARVLPGPAATSRAADRGAALIRALPVRGHQQGLRTEALRLFERSRSGCGTSGLFTEEYDVAQRQLRASIPQAFMHAALLETAARLMPSVRDGDVLDRSPGWE